MFKVFAVASQRESIYRKESWTVKFWRREGSLSPPYPRLLSVQIIGPHTTVLIARRQV